MNLTTFTARGAAFTVAAVAGFASYRHIVDVASGAGEHRTVAYALPLAIDGLIVVGTMAMIEDKRGRRIPRWSARVALVVGVLATLAANVASANPTITARLVAAVPAVAFLLAVEVLARRGKLRAAAFDPYVPPRPVEQVADAVPVPVQVEQIADSVTDSVTPVADVEPVADPWDHAEPVTETAPDPDPVKIEPASEPVPIPDAAPLPKYRPEAGDDRSDRAAARKAYRASVSTGKPLSGAALGRQFDRSPRWGVDRVNEVRDAERKRQERVQRTVGVTPDPEPEPANGAAVAAALVRLAR